jgi:muramoyltetrapeptide carboxypeptidase
MGLPTRTEFTLSSVLRAFSDGARGEVPRDPDDPYVRAIAPGRVTAPIVGGNLFTLVHLIGTPWEPVFDGAILFLEEVDEPPYLIDINLLHLRLAGTLDAVAGVVVGEMFNCDWREERPETPRTRSLEDVLENHLSPLGVPVLYKFPLGHGKHLATIPLGVQAKLDTDARTLTIDQPGVVTNT